MLKIKDTSTLEIITERLLLRPLQLNDAISILTIRSNDLVNKYIKRPRSISVEDAVDFIEKIDKKTAKGECIYRAIVLRESNTLIGTTCYFNFDEKEKMAEIGYELLPDYHGKGIMQEAVKEMINMGFNTIGLRIIVALTFAENIKSVQLLTKNKFKEDTTNQYVSKTIAEDLTVFYLLQ